MEADGGVPGYRIPAREMHRVSIVTRVDPDTGRLQAKSGVDAVEYVLDELLDDHWDRVVGTADAAVYESTEPGHHHNVTLDRDAGEMVATMRYDGEHGSADPFMFGWDGHVRDVEARLRGERDRFLHGDLTADPVHVNVEHAMRKR